MTGSIAIISNFITSIDNVTYKWPRVGGATMSRAQDGHIINSNFALSGPNPEKNPKGWLLFLESVSKFWRWK